MNCESEISEFDLLAYADGRLDGLPERKAMVERWLEARPDVRIALNRDRAILQLLRSGLAPIMADPVPPRIDQVLSDRTHHRPHVLRTRPAGAAAALICALVAGFLAREIIPARGASDIQAFAERFPEPAGIQATDALSPVDSATVPDLSGWGIRPIGTRSVTFDGRDYLEVIYGGADGEWIAVGRSAPRSSMPADLMDATFDQGRVAYWADEGAVYRVTGSVPEPAFAQIAGQLQKDASRTLGHSIPAPVPEPPVSAEAPVMADAGQGATVNHIVERVPISGL